MSWAPRIVVGVWTAVLVGLLGCALTGCPDDVASTDLAQPKDASASPQDLTAKD